MENANRQRDFEATHKFDDIIPETESSESDASQSFENDLAMFNDSYVSETPTESDDEIQPNNFNNENEIIFDTDPSSSDPSENGSLDSVIGGVIVPETSSESSEDNELAPPVNGPEFQAESNSVLQLSANEIHRAENWPNPNENDDHSQETASENDDESISNHIHVFENEIIPGTESSSSESDQASHNNDEMQAEIEQSIPETPSASDEESSSIHSNTTDNDIILETDSEASQNVGNDEAVDFPIDNDSFVPETPSASEDDSYLNPNSQADVFVLNNLPNEEILIASPVFNEIHLNLDNSIDAQVIVNEVDMRQAREISPVAFNPSADVENDRAHTSADQLNEENVVVVQNEPHQNDLQAILSQRERDFPFLVPGTVFSSYLKCSLDYNLQFANSIIKKRMKYLYEQIYWYVHKIIIEMIKRRSNEMKAVAHLIPSQKMMIKPF